MSIKNARRLPFVAEQEHSSTMSMFIKNHANPEQLYRQVEDLHSAGDNAAAEAVCKCIIDEFHPLIQQSAFFTLHAKILFELDRDPEAFSAVSQALLINKHDSLALEMQSTFTAQTDLQDGLYEQGESLLREQIGQNPLNLTASLILAHHLLWKNGSDVEIIQLYERCVQLRPRLLRARFGLAVAYKKVRNFTKAEVTFAECLKLDGEIKNHPLYQRSLQNI